MEHSAKHDTQRQRIDWLQPLAGKPGRAPDHGGNHGQVQQHRGGSGQGKALPGVEHASRQSDHRHEGNVGEHPAGHDDCGLKTPGLLLQATGHSPDQQRRRQHPEQTGQGQHPGQDSGNPVDQQVGGSITLLLLARRQHRHKGLAKSAFCKQPAKQVGDAKGDIEGVGHGTGAKQRGHQQLARQSGDARGQSQH